MNGPPEIKKGGSRQGAAVSDGNFPNASSPCDTRFVGDSECEYRLNGSLKNSGGSVSFPYDIIESNLEGTQPEERDGTRSDGISLRRQRPDAWRLLEVICSVGNARNRVATPEQTSIGLWAAGYVFRHPAYKGLSMRSLASRLGVDVETFRQRVVRISALFNQPAPFRKNAKHLESLRGARNKSDPK